MLIWADVAHLRHLIFNAPQGWLAALMMVMFNGVVFAGVQFGIAVMRMAEPDDDPKGGKRAPVGCITGELARVTAPATRQVPAQDKGGGPAAAVEA